VHTSILLWLNLILSYSWTIKGTVLRTNSRSIFGTIMPLWAYQYFPEVDFFFGQFWGQFHGQFLGQLCHLGHTSIFLRLNFIFGQFWGQFQGQFLGQLSHLGHTSIFLRLNLILFNFWKISGTISRSILGTVSWSILGTISWSIFGTILCHLGHTSSFLRLNFFFDNFWDNFKVIF